MKAKMSGETINIGGADGPTSVFVIGKDRKLTFRQKLQKFTVSTKRKFIEKRIKANSHSIEELCEYITNELGYKELSKTDEGYIEEYKEMRASLIMQHRPKLLGDFAELPILKEHTEAAFLEYNEKFTLRVKAAEAVPVDLFDIDFHKFVIEDGNNESHLLIEKTYGLISGGASGDVKTTKKFNSIYKRVYKYYGVTQADIDNKTDRYKNLVRTLSIH